MKPERIQQRLASEEKLTLSGEEINKRLSELQGWEILGEGDTAAIARVFGFPSLRAVSLFSSLMIEIGEEIGFVPEIRINYLEVTLRISTNAGNGINNVDFDIARFFQLTV